MRMSFTKKLGIMAGIVVLIIGAFFFQGWLLKNKLTSQKEKYELAMSEKDKTAGVIISELEGYKYLNDSLSNLPPDVKWRDRWLKGDTIKLIDTLFLPSDIPVESEPIIVKDTTGQIEVIYRKWGFPILYPKFTINWTSDISLGVSVRWLYCYKFGLYSGIYYSKDETMGIVSGIDYRMPYLTNTTLQCGGWLNNELDYGVSVGAGVFLR